MTDDEYQTAIDGFTEKLGSASFGLMAQGVLDLVAKAKDAERAAVLEEVRAWLEDYATSRAEEADEHRYKHGAPYIRALADGAEGVEGAFTHRFLAGKEGA